MKKFLITAILGITTLIGFGFCDTVTVLTGSATIVSAASSINFETGYCIQMVNTSTCPGLASFYNNNGELIRSGINGEYLYCFDFAGYYQNTRTNSSCSIYLYKSPFYGNNQECEECEECGECPAVDTGAILSGYIAISDITENYCISNGLCGEISTGSSTLYINDIRHESMPFINLYIPEEIERDYNYTGNGTAMEINVEGYGYDTEKMQSMVNTQYYKPTPEEMSGLIEKIADFLPLIAVALLIIWIRRVLKKVFRF